MSTNYYLCCKHCNSELKHIGKYVNAEFLSNMILEDFLKIYRKKIEYVIKNEYNEIFSLPELINQIGEDWKLQDFKGEWC